MIFIFNFGIVRTDLACALCMGNSAIASTRVNTKLVTQNSYLSNKLSSFPRNYIGQILFIRRKNKNNIKKPKPISLSYYLACFAVIDPNLK